MLPPLLGNPQSYPLLCLHSEVHNRSRCDIFQDRILAPGDVSIHIFQPNFLHSFPQRRLLAVPALPSPGLIYLDLPHNPVVENPQQLPDVRGHDPILCAEEQDGLHYGEVKTPQHPSVCALPPQDP